MHCIRKLTRYLICKYSNSLPSSNFFFYKKVMWMCENMWKSIGKFADRFAWRYIWISCFTSKSTIAFPPSSRPSWSTISFNGPCWIYKTPHESCKCGPISYVTTNYLLSKKIKLVFFNLMGLFGSHLWKYHPSKHLKNPAWDIQAMEFKISTAFLHLQHETSFRRSMCSSSRVLIWISKDQ